MTDFCGSIAELGQAYRQHTADPRAIAAAVFEKIHARESELNAWRSLAESAALECSEQRGLELEQGHIRGTLHGVPIGIKDLMDVCGEVTTHGSPAVNNHHCATMDAVLVRRLRDAGAIILGKTNCLEFGYGIDHPHVGQTRNPLDAQRTAGGSSGGSAAAVAAGQVWGATGTDTGGSIRIPAAYCGVVGIKPTWGLVPLDGVQPLSWSLDHAGPLARSCADAAILLETMAGCEPRPLRSPARPLRLAVIREHAEDECLTTEVSRVFERALRGLVRAGVEITRVTIPELKYADDALMNVMAPEASAVHADRLARQSDGLADETRLQLETGFAIPATTHIRAQRYRRYLGERLQRVLADVDALVGPTTPWTAREENPPLGDPSGAAEMRYIGPYNLTGMPALTLPCGYDHDGMPVGMQLGARPHYDRHLLAVGEAIEAILTAG